MKKNYQKLELFIIPNYPDVLSNSLTYDSENGEYITDFGNLSWEDEQ